MKRIIILSIIMFVGIQLLQSQTLNLRLESVVEVGKNAIIQLVDNAVNHQMSISWYDDYLGDTSLKYSSNIYTRTNYAYVYVSPQGTYSWMCSGLNYYTYSGGSEAALYGNGGWCLITNTSTGEDLTITMSYIEPW